MSRTYLRAAGLTAVGLLAAGLSQEGSARPLFDSAAVPQEHIAVLAHTHRQSPVETAGAGTDQGPTALLEGTPGRNWWSPA